MANDKKPSKKIVVKKRETRYGTIDPGTARQLDEAATQKPSEYPVDVAHKTESGKIELKDHHLMGKVIRTKTAEGHTVDLLVGKRNPLAQTVRIARIDREAPGKYHDLGIHITGNVHRGLQDMIEKYPMEKHPDKYRPISPEHPNMRFSPPFRHGDHTFRVLANNNHIWIVRKGAIEDTGRTLEMGVKRAKRRIRLLPKRKIIKKKKKK